MQRTLKAVRHVSAKIGALRVEISSVLQPVSFWVEAGADMPSFENPVPWFLRHRKGRLFYVNSIPQSKHTSRLPGGPRHSRKERAFSDVPWQPEKLKKRDQHGFRT